MGGRTIIVSKRRIFDALHALLFSPPLSLLFLIPHLITLSQVVAGTNFLMKIQVSEAADGFIHAKIFRPLPHTREPAELHEHSDIILGKTLEDPIEI